MRKKREKIKDYEKGRSYHCAYWGYDFKVLNVQNSNLGPVYVVEALQDTGTRPKGSIWSHMTRRGPKDYEIGGAL